MGIGPGHPGRAARGAVPYPAHLVPGSAERFADEVLVPDRGVPLVVLAGSSTALDPPGDLGNAALPGLARGLLTRGVPAVLAMTSDVSDRYAIQLVSCFY